MKETLGSPLLIRYQEAYDENPNSRVFAPLAEVYRKLGMLDKAQEILLKGIQIHPDYVFGHLGLAQCYGDLNQYEEVYKTLSPFVQSYRDNIKLQKLFAVSCEKNGRRDEALETYKYLLFLNPRDTKIAEIVNNLESSLLENKIIIDEEGEIIEPEAPTQTFDVDMLSSNPDEYDYDDWRQEDFAFSKSFESEEGDVTSRDPKHDLEEDSDENWSMAKTSEEAVLTDEQEDEEERTFTVDTSLIKPESEEESPEQVTKTGPVITHTLVDLYCSQGHLEKAKEILEKILQLNPHDQKTRDRLDELSEMLETHPKEVDDYESQDLLDELEDAEVVQQSNDNSLMDYFDQKVQEVEVQDKELDLTAKKQKLEIFLAKIKKRAEEVSKSSSGATP